MQVFDVAVIGGGPSGAEVVAEPVRYQGSHSRWPFF